MKRYSVYVQFTNGVNEYAINLLHIDYLDIAEFGVGIFGNMIRYEDN